MNLRNFKMAAICAVVLGTASMSFAQCPKDRYQSPAPWDATVEYSGCWQGGQGDTVQYGEYGGKPLYWWAKFAADGKIKPGEFASEGGTSPWVLINSLSAVANGGRPNFTPVTWNGGNGSTAINSIGAMQAKVPTWRDAANGAYTITLDDIGAMPFDKSVQPALDIWEENGGYEEGKYKDIRMSWGVYASKMTDEQWKKAINMVANGHEMFSHTLDHTSAADQWLIFYPGKMVSQTDPAVPGEVRGLTVAGSWKVTVKSSSGKSWGPIQWDDWTGNLKDFLNPDESVDTAKLNRQVGDFGNPAVVNTFPRKPIWGTPAEGSLHGGKLGNAAIDEWNEQGIVYNYTLIVENELVEFEYPAGWAGQEYDPAGGIAWNDPNGFKLIRMKEGVEEKTLKTGQKVYVKYTNGFNPDFDEYEGYQEGLIAATGVSNFETGLLVKDYPFYFNGTQLNVKWETENCNELGKNQDGSSIVGNFDQGCYTANVPGYSLTNIDQGRNGFVAKIFCIKGWDGGQGELGKQALRNIDTANHIINKNIYSNVKTAGEHFAKGKQNEYLGYPFDAYSEKTHDNLIKAKDRANAGHFVGARGGAKSGKPMPGDFYHPYRIDFDAFYINNKNWTVGTSNEAAFKVPNNAHVLLGLNEMVDEIVKSNGYMVRELHAVADMPGASWYDSSNPSDPDNSDIWAINNAGMNQGGWWGGITKQFLKDHFDHLAELIGQNKLTVFTPSEAVKYRMTANAFNTDATLSAEGENWKVKLSPKGSEVSAIDEFHKEEISVIVNLGTAVEKLAVSYDGTTTNKNEDNSPRRKPRPMNPDSDGSASIWSVSINPFKSNDYSALLIKNGDWFGQGTDQCDPNIPGDCDMVSIAGNSSAKKINSFAFTGIRNGQINLRLTAGNYNVSLYNLQGRIVGSANISAVNGVNATGLKTTGLAKGMLILRVKDAKGASVLQNKIMIK